MARVGGALGLLRLAIVAAVLLSLAVIWHELDWAAVGDALAQVHWPAALTALACVLAASWAKGMRWRLLLAPEVRIGRSRAFGLILAGQLANNGLPVRMGVGEAARVALLTLGPTGSAYAAGTIVAEKLLDALGLLLVALLLGVLMPLPAWLRLAAPVLTLLGALVLVVALWLGLSNGPRWLREQSAALWFSVRVAGRPRVLGPALLWTAAGLAAGAWANAWSLDAVGVPSSIGPVLLVLLALYLGGSLPSPPGRIGLFQALCMASLLPFGVAASTAFAFGIVHYLLVVVVPSLLGALYVVAWAGGRPSRAAASAAPAARPEPKRAREG